MQDNPEGDNYKEMINMGLNITRKEKEKIEVITNNDQKLSITINAITHNKVKLTFEGSEKDFFIIREELSQQGKES